MNLREATAEDYRVFAMQRDSYFKDHQTIVIDSGRLTIRALKSSEIDVISVLCPLQFYEKYREFLERGRIQILIADEKQTKRLTGFRIHQGVMSLAHRPKDVPLRALGKHIIALNGVNNAENVGTIVRNALALQAPHILIDENSCSPLIRRAIRVSMGSVFKCQLHHCKSLATALTQLKNSGYQVVAADLSSKSICLNQHSFAPHSVLVLGNEGEGIDIKISELADLSVHIPISPEIDSLNVAVASGIFLNHMANSR